MVKHTQTICLSVFDHFVVLVLKGLRSALPNVNLKILGLQSAALTLKWSFSASYNYISRSAICKADLDCILFDEK